jgi:hypothetical protein
LISVLRRKRPRVGVLSGPGLCVLIGLGACGADSKTGSSADTVLTDQTRPQADSLRVSILAPSEVQVGDSVPIELRIENVTTSTLSVNLQGRDIVFDIVVSTMDGNLLWRRLQGQTTQSILRIETLAAGQVLRLRDVWRAAAAGDYRVRGVVPTDAAPLQTELVSVRVR